MENLEQELKLALSEREFEILSGLSEALPQAQTNHYFAASGTKKLSAEKADAVTAQKTTVSKPSFENAKIAASEMVRIREKNSEFLLCYKRRILNQNGVSVCDERESKLSHEIAQTFLARGIKSCEINEILQTNFDRDLTYLGKAETFRKTFLWRKWRFELDETLFCGRRDFELECENDSAESLEELKRVLASEFGLQIRFSKPKFQRFLEAQNDQSVNN